MRYDRMLDHVKGLEACGVIKVLSFSPLLAMPASLVPKASGGSRFILNCQKLNDFSSGSPPEKAPSPVSSSTSAVLLSL